MIADVNHAITQAYGIEHPAGWQNGDSGMKATSNGVAEYLAEKANNL